jgi:opacity protein-like surface antigen
MRRPTAKGWMAVGAIVCAAMLFPTAAAGQQRPGVAARPAPVERTAIRGFGDVGVTLFSASDTFDAVLGSPSGVFVGGGVEVVLPQRVFFNVRLSRLQKSGERVFVLDNEVFPLGIETKVKVTPVEVTAGYRFRGKGQTRRLIPYIGGGIGWHRYSETSDFADSSEDVNDTFQGYHALGGIEFRLNRLFAIGGEGQWTTVPDALGAAVSSASEAFGESDLGGLGFRLRFVVGR